MKTVATWPMALLLLLLAIPGGPAVAEGVMSGAPDLAAVVAGNNQFALDLYQLLAAEEDGNVLFSPYSVSTALAMTYAGARGNTEAQMADVLHFTLPQEQLHAAFGTLTAGLHGSYGEDYQLSVANRLWGQLGYPFLPEFLQTTAQHYGAGLEQLDFAYDPEQARQTINTWVEQQTQEKIKDLIPPGIINTLTRLVLTNAIYFKSNWQYQFDEELTQVSPFSVSVDEQVNVAMMNQAGEFNYAIAEEYKLLELPYSGEDLSMLFFLPHEVDGLAAMEDWLTAETLQQSVDSLHTTELYVSLPRFEITGDYKLGQTLSTMGMPEAFIPGMANFSGIDGSRHLFINEVVHKAFMEVNESGTEAAAATGVIIEYDSVPPTFRADHPFAFVLRDNQTGSILFMGRVIEPGTSALEVTSGDMDGDGIGDADDIDLLRDAIAAGNPDLKFDLNGDGVVGGSDFDFLIQEINETEFGDVTLDQTVDAHDLAVVRTHFGGTGGWASGNMTVADMDIDAADLALVRTHFAFSTSPATIPEPGAMLLLATGLLALWRPFNR